MRNGWQLGLGLLLLAQVAQAQQLSFPTAEGFGRFAVGGRGGRAYNINSLTPGAGSGGTCTVGGCSGGTITLRDCIFDRFGVGARTCIFRVGGTIDMTGAAWRSVPAYLTIAGQTAPGDGIMLRGVTLDIWSGPGLAQGGHDVIVRHLRVRPGKSVFAPEGAGALKAFGGPMGNATGENVYNVIFDHYSVGWAPDDTTGSLWAYNVTYQWGILSEGIGNGHSDPSKCMTYGWVDNLAHSGLTVHHNLMANHWYRCPSLGVGKVQVINNIFYNIGEGSQVVPAEKHGGAPVLADFVGNYYQAGPAYTSVYRNTINLLSCGARGVFDMCGLDVTSLVALSGNYHNVLRPNNGLPEDALVVYEGERQIPTTSTRQYPALATETAAAQAATDVLARAGAYAVAGGTATVRRDSIDQRAITDFQNGTGTFDTCTGPGTGPCEDAFGGYPTYANGTPYTDTDGDGMADAWERAHGLNPNNPADGPQLAANGYTNLENFLNELAGDKVFGTTILPAPKNPRRSSQTQ